MSGPRAGWSPATLLGVVRGGYGALQLAAPALVSERLQGRPLDTRGRAIARILGARQLAQAVASGREPGYPVLALGVEVDLLHALSMLGLAAASPARRRAALTDTLIAASFAAAGALAARAAPDGRPPPGPGGTPGGCARAGPTGSAGAPVPGYRARPTTPGPGTPRFLTGSTQGTILPSGHRSKTEMRKR